MASRKGGLNRSIHKVSDHSLSSALAQIRSHADPVCQTPTETLSSINRAVTVRISLYKTITTSSMSLLTLPTELLYNIWEHIHQKKDVNALQKVNHRFYQIFNSWFYRFDHKYCGSRALFWAVRRNETRTAQISIEERAAIPKGDDCLQVALIIALKRNSSAIIRLLITQGTDLNLQAALQLAVEYGSCEIVKLLKDYGANINGPIDTFGYLLQNASWLGDQEMAQLLLDEGADVNALGGYYGSALQAASWEGSWSYNDKVVNLLLSHGAEVNAQGGYFGNALQAASSGRNQQVVKLLISHGADINLQGGKYSNALQAASWAGNNKIVSLLLSYGANVNAQGGYFGTALQAASLTGCISIVKLLLSKGANVSAQGGRYGYAYQAASVGGHKRVAGLLLYWYCCKYLGGLGVGRNLDVPCFKYIQY
jgi:ankyrin repeat protein